MIGTCVGAMLCVTSGLFVGKLGHRRYKSMLLRYATCVIN